MSWKGPNGNFPHIPVFLVLRFIRMKAIGRGQKGKNKMKQFTFYASLFITPLLLLPALQAAEPKWKVRSAYQYQDLSFTSNGHGANFLLTYNRPREWGLRGGFHYVNKFGDSAPGYDLGGTYWATQTTTLSFDAEFAPGQIVIPRQGYTLEASQVLFKTLVPAISYRFADYSTANAHIVMPSITWYFYPRFDWMTRYFLSFSQFAVQSATDHSVMTRINWNVIDPLIVFIGYSRANESFESGNPVSPTGGFSANHVFTGWSWDIFKGIGLDFSFDYEDRNNGSTLKTYDVGTSYRW